MRNKGRFQFVDELRKINTIQKMGYIESFYPETFEDTKQDNTKFIRYKEELAPDIEQRKEHILFNNDIITNYKKDIQPSCNHNFGIKNDEVSRDIDYYHQWSQSLNQEIKQRDYEHRFFFQRAIPPPRLKDDKKEEDPTTGRLTTGKYDKQTSENNEDANIDLPQRGKYNFFQITKLLFTKDKDKDEKEATFARDAALKNELTEYRKIKNLQQIDKIGDFHEEFNKFNYFIDITPQQYHIDFIDDSVAISNNNIKIDYFRDIGRPSRNIMDYTLKNYRNMTVKDEDQNYDIQSIQNQDKRELLYLYFLKDEELKINKNGINFYDLANISMARITPLNAHMCVRNEKVTRAQYLKLLERMQRYNMRENQGGKPKGDKQVGTQQLQDMNDLQNTAGSMGQVKAIGIDIDKAIDEINLIKREVKLLQNATSKNSFDNNNFNAEAFIKLQKLLSVLYDNVTDGLKEKYPMSQIRSHLHQIQGKNKLGYDKIRVLLFIADCYEEIFAKQNQKPNLKDIYIKQQKTPEVIKYKGKKATDYTFIQTKKIYGFDQKGLQTDRKKTPLKTQTVEQTVKTPLTKKYYDQSTRLKMSATAKK